MEYDMGSGRVIGSLDEIVKFAKELHGQNEVCAKTVLVKQGKYKRNSTINAPVVQQIAKCLREHGGEWLTAKQISALSGVKNVNQRMGDLLNLKLAVRRRGTFWEYHSCEHDLITPKGVTYITNTDRGVVSE